jgi:polysaccharide deacetylase 2 family uncharacterized protein YibQ
MARKSKAKTRLAFILLSLAAVSLIVALVTCLPKRQDTAVQSAPRTETAPIPQTPAPRGPDTEGTPFVQESGRLALNIESPYAARPERPERVGILAVIIDDAGYNLSDLKPFLEFPGPLAIAVLPNLPHSVETAKRVKAAGKELLLHCPMEPINGNEDPGPGVLRTDQSDAEIERLLISAFASVPGAEGLNNHMGSKATADERLMSVVFSFLKREGKYFVDSRTTPDSVAEVIAARFGVPFLKRDGFIDNERDEESLKKTIEAGASTARSRGKAILIGHIHTPEILAILRQSIPGSETRLTGLSEILSGWKEPRE